MKVVKLFEITDVGPNPIFKYGDYRNVAEKYDLDIQLH